MVADDHNRAVVGDGVEGGKHSHWNLRPCLKEDVTWSSPCPWATARVATLAHSRAGIMLLPVHLWLCKKKLKFTCRVFSVPIFNTVNLIFDLLLPPLFFLHTVAIILEGNVLKFRNPSDHFNSIF